MYLKQKIISVISALHDYRVVMLESNLLRTGTLTNEEGHDLYILAGHEASY